MATPDYGNFWYTFNTQLIKKEKIMKKWYWQHENSGRILRLFHGDRMVLAIDGTRLLIKDKVGVERFDRIIGQGDPPTWEDEQLILEMLNKDITFRKGSATEEVPVNKIFGEISKERECQNDEQRHNRDDEHTVNDWIMFINRFATYIADTPKKAQRLNLIKVAATAIDAIEALDRNGKFPPRHYDEA